MNMFSIHAVLISTVVYVLPIIIYRFLIHKKPLEHKKAKWGSICYAVICYIPLFFLPTALFQAFIVIFFTIVNYYILAGIKENPHGQILLYHLILYFSLIVAQRILSTVFRFTLHNEHTISSLIWTSRVLLTVFGMYKWVQIKNNVLEKFRQKDLYKNKSDNNSEII